MENQEKTVEKRTQQDYTMAFKLGIVSRLEMTFQSHLL